ncbi:MAG: tetratricopeptide repeat protein [Bacteroidetes bacterium]|nr:tetratricopeptide repeat protein [Bacteroidota bacterium]
MTGKQWAGIAAAVVLTIGIYFMPQTVVQNKSEMLPAASPAAAGEVSADAASQPEHFEGDGHDHGDDPQGDGHDHSNQRQELSQSARKHLQSLKESASNTGDKQKFAIFADSLAANWAKWAWYDSAAHWAEKAVTAQPTTERRYQAGSLWYEAFQLAPDLAQQRLYGERAAGHLKKVLEKEPKHAKAQIRLALTHVVSENPMQGIVLLREVLEREPNNAEALFHMGVLSFQSNQYDKAIERFEALLKQDATHKEGHFYLALSYMQLGQEEKAREHMLAVQKLEPNPEVRAVVDEYLGRLNKAN